MYLPEDTKKYIKSVVHNEISKENFWRDIFNKINIDNHVLSYLQNNLPTHVQRQITILLPNMVSNRINEILPGLVRQQLEFQLQNNSIFNNIFDKHSQRLNSELEVKSNDILNKIVNDDKYHELTKLHLESIDYKGNNLLSELKTKASLQEKQLNEKIDKAIEQMNTNTSRRISTLESEQAILKSIIVIGMVAGGYLWYSLVK